MSAPSEAPPGIDLLALQRYFATAVPATAGPLTVRLDLGLLQVYWDPVTEPVLGVRHAPTANPGFLSAGELAERYAATSGRCVSGLEFYRALGYFKLAVIAEGIHQRYLDGETVGDGFDTVGTAVPALLESGLDTLGARRP